MAQFIEINGDLFNVDKIQVINRTDQKNSLGNDNGIYILEIHMESGKGSVSKVYPLKRLRDEDFLLAKKQLEKYCNVLKGYVCKLELGAIQDVDVRKKKSPPAATGQA